MTEAYVNDAGTVSDYFGYPSDTADLNQATYNVEIEVSSYADFPISVIKYILGKRVSRDREDYELSVKLKSISRV